VGLVASTGDFRKKRKKFEVCTCRWVSGIEMILRDVGCDWTQMA